MSNLQISFTEKNLSRTVDYYRRFQDQWQSLITWWLVVERDEWKAFIYFLEDRYSGKGKYSRDIIERIQQAFSKNTTTISGNQLLQKYFPSKPTDSFEEQLKKLGKEVKILIRVIQNFLVHVEGQADEQSYHRLLLRSLKRRKNNKLFKESVHKFEALLDQEPPALMVAADQWWVKHQNYYHQQTEHFSTENTLFIQGLEAFEAFRQIFVLRNYIELLNRDQSVDDPDIVVIQQLKHDATAIIQSTENKSPLILLYCTLAQLLASQKLDLYPSFVQQYLSYNAKLNKVDHIVIVRVMMNFLYRSGNRNHNGVNFRRFFAWMLQAQRHDLYHYEGRVSDDVYLNFFTMASLLKKIPLYDIFAQKYSPFLEAELRSLVLNWCTVKLLFDAQKFEAAREQLILAFPLYSKQETKYDFRIKGLRVMVSYRCKILKIRDEKMNEELINSITNLAQYCRRMLNKGMNVREARSHLQFLRIVKTLSDYQNMEKYQRRRSSLKMLKINQLLGLYKQDEPLVYRQWLEAQIAEILEKNKNSNKL